MSMFSKCRSLLQACAWLLAVSVPIASPINAAELTVYTAKTIITMEPALPEATAVAVDEGRIVAVGSLDSLQSWIKQRGARIDRQFDDKVLMPGFIDPHLHPSLPAVITQFPVIAPDAWSLPTGEFAAAGTQEQYTRLLQERVARHREPDIPFVTWGYHPLWHGKMHRPELDALFPDQAVILWHRSFHELIVNSAAIEALGLPEDIARSEGVDWKEGLFSEAGAMQLVPRMGFLFAPERYGKGMQNLLAMMRRGGVTTALDMGTGVFGNPALEIGMIRKMVADAQPPVRMILTPIITDFLARGKTIPEAMAEIDHWRAGNTHRVKVDRRFKLMLDGAVFSGLSQFGFPGYIDGHEGEWLVPEKTIQEWAQAFWDADYQLHAHTNGDASAARFIDLLRTLLRNTPRTDHRTSLEHFAFTTEDQNRQLKALGAVVSANPYYQYLLSDIYSEKWLGEDRGRQMVRLGSLERLGVPFALHSDCPMAPLEPLTLVDNAVNRVTINGQRNAASERISLDAALRAITIDAAWVMGYENDIGSIAAGKKADFVVLEKNPYKVPLRDIKSIGIWGTVFEGEPFPVEQ